MYDTIDDGNIAIDRIHWTFLIEEDGVALTLADCQLMIVYIGQRELCIFFSISNCGDNVNRISLRLHITAVNDGIKHDYLTN